MKRIIILISLSLLILKPESGFPQKYIFDIYEDAQDLTISGSDTEDCFGYKVVSGDINGNGKNDLIISAHNGWGIENTRPQCGEIYIIYDANLDTDRVITTQANVIIYGQNIKDYLGTSLTTGDINSDGKDDIIIGAFNASGPENSRSGCGEVYVIYGKDEFSNVIDLALTSPDIIFYGANAGDYLGNALCTGDINADGIDDIIIGASNFSWKNNGDTRWASGCAYVIYGSTNNFNPTIDFKFTPPDIIIYGADSLNYLSTCICVGDINDDNKDDIIIAANRASGPQKRYMCGEVYVIYGKDKFSNVIDLASTSADITIYGANPANFLGSRISIGDINGDYIDDIIISASYASGTGNSRSGCGEVYVIYGKDEFSNVIDLASTLTDITIYGADAGDYLGSDHCAGDLNGDGIDDIIIGAYLGDGRSNHYIDSGEVYVIYGGKLPETIDLVSDQFNMIIYGANREDRILTVHNEDINNDGIKDLIIGAPNSLGKDKKKAGEVYIIYGWRPLSSPQVSISRLNNLIVTLNLSVGGDPTEMLISGDITDSFKDTWIPYSPSKEATLTGSEGTKTVTAKFRNALGRESEICNDTVGLEVSSNKVEAKRNRFNPAKGEKASFVYTTNTNSHLKIEVYNIAGELVKKLLDEERPAEIGIIEWDGNNDYGKRVGSGMYLFILEAGAFKETERILVTK